MQASVGGDGTRLRAIEAQMARIERRLNTINQISRRYWNWRRSLIGSGLVISFAAYELAGDLVCVIAASIFIILLIVVARYHARVRDSIARYELWAKIKATQLARITLDWTKIPPCLE